MELHKALLAICLRLDSKMRFGFVPSGLTSPYEESVPANWGQDTLFWNQWLYYLAGEVEIFPSPYKPTWNVLVAHNYHTSHKNVVTLPKQRDPMNPSYFRPSGLASLDALQTG